MKKLWLLLCLLASSAEAAVSQDANGWTVITASGDSRLVYVSSINGNNAYDGLSPSTPKQTLAAGYALMRDGFPDHMLLEKGSTWTNANGLGDWDKSGRSATEPMLIGTYGTGARPIINPSSGTCFVTLGPTGPRSYIAIIGIDCYAGYRDYNFGGTGNDNKVGIRLLEPGAWFLLEDSLIRYWTTGVTIDADGTSVITDVSLRRNVIVDSYTTQNGTHSQGFFCSGGTGVLVEENLFDHNGWDASREGDDIDGGATIFNHNIYLQSVILDSPNVQCASARVIGNISANASSHGAQVRTGGTISNNLFIDNPIGLLIGSSQTLPSLATVTNNVVDGGANICNISCGDSGIPFPRGTAYGNNNRVANGLTFTNNIAMHVGAGTGAFHGLQIDCRNGDALSTTQEAAVGICTGDIITRNVWFDWNHGCPEILTGSATGQTITNNWYSDVPANCTASGTNQKSSTFRFNDNTRTVGTYTSIVLGLAGTHAAFIAAARLQSKDNWNTNLLAANVNAWIRTGFLPRPPKRWWQLTK